MVAYLLVATICFDTSKASQLEYEIYSLPYAIVQQNH